MQEDHIGASTRAGWMAGLNPAMTDCEICVIDLSLPKENWITRASRVMTEMKIVKMKRAKARRVKVDWAKVDATTEADIARHAREDGTVTPSDRAWKKMLREGRVKLVPPPKVDVRSIRERLKLSQSDFAARFGFTASAVRQWEQGRRQPHGPARVL
ncbi:MAG TPA: helix-turn-helix domain-containing protein, partial [Rhizomicrobium sp.]|nr:helix-turn-helix domain-containing protein [Rhizomicrobium sp.]